MFNNTSHLLAVRFLVAFFQPTHTIVSYSLLIHGPLISLQGFLVPVPKLTVSSLLLLSLLSSLFQLSI
jgi:hypothetical protein